MVSLACCAVAHDGVFAACWDCAIHETQWHGYGYRPKLQISARCSMQRADQGTPHQLDDHSPPSRQRARCCGPRALPAAQHRSRPAPSIRPPASEAAEPSAARLATGSERSVTSLALTSAPSSSQSTRPVHSIHLVLSTASTGSKLPVLEARWAPKMLPQTHCVHSHPHSAH